MLKAIRITLYIAGFCVFMVAIFGYPDFKKSDWSIWVIYGILVAIFAAIGCAGEHVEKLEIRAGNRACLACVGAGPDVCIPMYEYVAGLACGDAGQPVGKPDTVVVMNQNELIFLRTGHYKTGVTPKDLVDVPLIDLLGKVPRTAVLHVGVHIQDQKELFHAKFDAFVKDKLFNLTVGRAFGARQTTVFWEAMIVVIWDTGAGPESALFAVCKDRTSSDVPTAWLAGLAVPALEEVLEEALDSDAIGAALTVADELNDLREALASSKVAVKLAGIAAARLRQCLSSANNDPPTND